MDTLASAPRAVAPEQALLVVGAGIGGLAAAYACARQGWSVRVLERSAAPAALGAGIQLGPNAVRLLHAWGLGEALAQCAVFPDSLHIRSASNATLLARLPLGARSVQRYGAGHACIARADLHGLLLQAVQTHEQAQQHIQLDWGCRVEHVTQDAQQVQLQYTPSPTNSEAAVDTAKRPALAQQTLHTPLLIGADGLWSRIRPSLVADGAPRSTGHLAYRAMLRQADLPVSLRSQLVTVWLGSRFHVVQYPVAGGAYLNVVAIVHGNFSTESSAWEQTAHAQTLREHLHAAAAPLQDLASAIDHCLLWPIYERTPMHSAAAHAQGRIALLGDAAHPMPPYMAQGAGMAIEDAYVLAQCLAQSTDPTSAIPQALQRYADLRWQRNARVQRKSQRNGTIFHLSGLLALARNTTLRTLGAHLVDVPWLYRGV